MKDHILHLHPHDDFASARDKIGWAQAGRGVLVWPQRGQPLVRRLDLVLLHRHAEHLGARLGFVTADPEVADLAGELGIPIFPTVEASHLERWTYRHPRPLPPRPEPLVDLADPPGRERPLPPWLHWVYSLAPLERIARYLLFALALVAVGAAALFVLPSATLTLVPASQVLRVPVEITADPVQAQPDSVNRIIPARVVEVRVRASTSAITSGLQEQPNTQAVGNVVFTNRRAQSVNIPVGTVVRTTGGTTVRFATTQLAVTPAEQGGSVVVPVKALDAGPVGNVGAETINAIDGAIAFDLFVVNPEPASGGAVLTVATVTEADQAALRETALAQLKQQAVAAMQGQLGENEFLAPDTLRVAGTPQETFSHFVGEKADTLTLDMQAVMTATSVNERGAQAVALQALKAALKSGQSLIPGSETFGRQTTLESDEDGRVTFSLVATGRVAPVIEVSLIRQMVQGAKPTEAARRLQSELVLAEPPQIESWPEWLGRMPWLGARINVVLVSR